MGLFTPFWKLDSPYSKKAQSVYQKIDALTDQSLLEKIAIEAPLAEVRERAVKKIVNQIIISKVILEDKNFDVRFRAIHRSSDLELLKKIVVTDKSYSHGGGHRYTLAAAAWSVLVSNNALDEAFLERLALDESIGKTGI